MRCRNLIETLYPRSRADFLKRTAQSRHKCWRSSSSSSIWGETSWNVADWPSSSSVGSESCPEKDKRREPTVFSILHGNLEPLCSLQNAWPLVWCNPPRLTSCALHCNLPATNLLTLPLAVVTYSHSAGFFSFAALPLTMASEQPDELTSRVLRRAQVSKVRHPTMAFKCLQTQGIRP